jgi:hypothetical protein
MEAQAEAPVDGASTLRDVLSIAHSLGST